MKLMSYATPRGSSFGVVRGEYVIDLGMRFGQTCPDLKGAITQGRLNSIASLVETAQPDYRVDDLHALPVIPNPNRILCIGLNYVAHRSEGNHQTEAAAPTVFLRLPESQVGHGGSLVCPRESDHFDYEAEVAVVIGRPGRRISEQVALQHIAGISAYNDASVRDWQLLMGQWAPGKNFPATGAFGPWMVTPDELPPDRPLSLVCRLNGEEMQRSNTDLMMFSIAKLIAFTSTFTTLEPGDVLVTGTPGGVGMRRDPKVWMKEGDVVEIEVEGVGVLRNPVVKER